jgi:hypothetical protein
MIPLDTSLGDKTRNENTSLIIDDSIFITIFY